VPASFDMPAFDLSESVAIRQEEPERFQVVFLDTDDLRLARWGASLRHRSGAGWTASLPAAEGRAPLAAGRYDYPDATNAPPPAAVDLLRGFARSEPLKPVARLRTQRRRVEARNGDDASAELVDDEVSVLSGRRIAARYRRLSLFAPAGAGRDLMGAMEAELRAAGAGPGDPTPDHVAALGPRATGPPDVVSPELPPDPTAADLVRAAMASAVTLLICHHAAVVVGEDPEGVHQARIASRKVRSTLRTFAAVLDPEWTESLREEVGWLGGVLGDARDADVLSARLRERAPMLAEGSAGLDALLEAAESARSDARSAMLLQYRGPRYAVLLDRLVEAAREPAFVPAAGDPASSLVPGLREQWRAVRRAGKAARQAGTDDDLHELRILAKRCRYSAEALAPVGGKRARSFAAAAGRLQAVLGEHNDAVTAQRWLREWSSGRSSAAEAFTAGEMAGIERGVAAAARDRWHKAWRALAERDPADWR
jgi:CHAD domain-containing protein